VRFVRNARVSLLNKLVKKVQAIDDIQGPLPGQKVRSDMAEAEDYEYRSDIEFSAPPSSSAIENIFRIAQVLERKEKCSEAISRYLLVCDSIDRVIQMNPGAEVDIKWVLLSLENIAKIYEVRKDWPKSIAFRKCLTGFAQYIQSSGGRDLTGDGDEDKDDSPHDFDTITTAAVAYRALFARVREAAELPEKPSETTADRLQQLAAAHEKQKQDRVERVMKLLDDEHEARMKAIQNSFWKRNWHRAMRHPLITGVTIAVLSLLLVFYVTTASKRKKKVAVPEDFDAQMAFLERIVAEQRAKQKEATPSTPRRTLKPTPSITWGAPFDL
jgi:hypothetical protein